MQQAVMQPGADHDPLVILEISVIGGVLRGTAWHCVGAGPGPENIPLCLQDASCTVVDFWAN